MTTWDQTVAEWSRPPVDDVGYFPSKDLVAKSDAELKGIVDRMRVTRYTGWRNHNNKWRDVMGLDELTGKDVLDFGCGMATDALELGLAGNSVALADLSRDNLNLGQKVLRLYGVEPSGTYLVTNTYPFLDMPDQSLDVFYCNGVLHHIEWAREIMERAHELLRDGGEVRLMVYSDIGWKTYMGTEPPADTKRDPKFRAFIRVFDQVGFYADWYNREKIERMFGDLFEVERFEYITDNSRYLAAVLRKKG